MDRVDQPFDVHGFLDEPSRLAQVAAVSPCGIPLLASLWFAFENDRFWFHSAQDSPLLLATRRGATIAVIVDDFQPGQRIVQIRVRGRGRVEDHDPQRVRRIYRRYLGDAMATWPLTFPERLNDPAMMLWTVRPETGLAVDNTSFVGNEVRWRTLADCPFVDP